MHLVADAKIVGSYQSPRVNTMAYLQEKFTHPMIDEFLKVLVDPGRNQVLYWTLRGIDSALYALGFTMEFRKPWGPRSGWMLIYVSQVLRDTGHGLLVRIKTHGDSPWPPNTLPHAHLVVSWVHGDFLKYSDELRKYSATGLPESSAPPSGAGSDPDGWGWRTHIPFPCVLETSWLPEEDIKRPESVKGHA